MSAYKTSVKRSISLSPVVSGWADEMAAKRGFGTNFSAFIADLIRREKERHESAGKPAGRNAGILRPTDPSLNER